MVRAALPGDASAERPGRLQTEEAEPDLCQEVLPEGTSRAFPSTGEGSILWCVREVGLGEETLLPAG